MPLRYLLFLTFSAISVLPVIMLTVWISTDALDREMNSVREKHLVIANNLGSTLERYAIDLMSGFDLVANLPYLDQKSSEVTNFIAGLNFSHFCIADLKTGNIVYSVAPATSPCPHHLRPDRFQTFADLLDENRIVFSPVMMSPKGLPVIYMLRAYGNRLVVGEVSTKYIVDQGKAVAFGIKGHAAIVDHTGQVIAHPLPAWRNILKDISKIPPVQRMMTRNTGAMTFYSPALKADMVAGYTFVPATGWGVMVPQPIEEIRSVANKIQNSAISIGLAGVIASALLSWFVSGYLTRSISSVVSTTRQMAKGDLDVRIKMNSGFEAKEIVELGQAFNSMAEDIAKTHGDLSKAAVLADDANRAKTLFLANVSHELRTPLNPIIGFAGVLQSEKFDHLDSEKRREYAKDICDSGTHLLEVINEILDISRIEAGEMHLNEGQIEVGSVVNSCMKMVSERATRANIKIYAEIDEAIPLLFADETRVRQILANLLSNAINFTPNSGKITISAKIDDNGGFVLSVTDTGVGIAPEDISKVLEPFGQAEEDFTRTQDGVGLGLALSNRLVEMHGGTLEIRSRVEQGTVVSINFPVDRTIIPKGH